MNFNNHDEDQVPWTLITATMNRATGDDLSINSSYAAECVSLLFDIFQQETVFSDACGRYHREAVRAEQLAYKLMVCAESLQSLGIVAAFLSPKLSAAGTAFLDCLYAESSNVYPALRAAAEETKKVGVSTTWPWLKSIEHQDWLRAHLACLESLARVLCLALTSQDLLHGEVNEVYMEPGRQLVLRDAQLSSAIKRFVVACETCQLNLNTLEQPRKEPWKDLPWKLIKPVDSPTRATSKTSMCRWLLDLGWKCDRSKMDIITHDWDRDRDMLASALLSSDDVPAPNGDDMKKGRRRSNVRWRDEEGGRLVRGSSVLKLDHIDTPRRSSISARRGTTPATYQPPTCESAIDEELELSPRSSAAICSQKFKRSVSPHRCQHLLREPNQT